MRTVFLVISFLFTGVLYAQSSFVQKCLGTWQGTMYMYHDGKLRDSVNVKLIVANTTDTGVWVWKTEYLSEKFPMVKDYKLKVKDSAKNIYLTDEGDGLTLDNYVVGDKMYSLFETEKIFLTANYELRDDKLIFEVTSGKKLTATHPEVNNYSVADVQRVVFRIKL